MGEISIPFIKMHGAGNDFVFLTREKTQIPISRRLAQLLLDRHFGIGGDQLLVLRNQKKRTCQLQIYNSDGSQAEMCGNGVRAVAHYLNRFKGVKKDFTILTKAGPIGIGFKNGKIEVDMGRPLLEGSRIPAKAHGEITGRPLSIADKVFRIHAVSMGNPHCVIFVKNVRSFPVEKYGPLIENHPFFPSRMNVEFAEVVNSKWVKARVWERGAGETLACGTGACAIGVAAARIGKTARQVTIDLPGGQLGVRWGENDHVYLTGPARVSYEGYFLLND